MEAADVNGGNAEVAREEPNLESTEVAETQEDITDNNVMPVKMEEVGEVNGDLKNLKKKGTPVFMRKIRKFKANSTSTVEIDAKSPIRGLKRKLSEPDDISSEDSTEFNGFDSQVIDSTETGSLVLQKLIAEAESSEMPQTKRQRRSTSKGFSSFKNFDDKDDELGLTDVKMEAVDPMEIHKIKKEKESDTDSIGIPNSFESDMDPLKTEESAKSPNSSANSSPSGIIQRLKGTKAFRGISPGSAAKQKLSIDISNPAFREPFKYGWKRELVFRASSEHSVKRMADIYYYTPKGKKVRSSREVAEFLNTKELTIDNFTFFKEPLGVNNPDYEIIRDAKRIKDSLGPGPTPPKKKAAPKKTKKSVEKPLTPPPSKLVPKTAKVTPASFKVKLPARKGQAKKEAKSPPKESEMLPPQWNSPAGTRRNQPVIEKSPPAKTKRVLKAKVQEPCSIRCSTSMGLIPSLQCSLCLCLYHPECVGGVDIAGTDEYVCKNCHEDSEKSHQHQQVAIAPPPPPLIPISMIGAQNTKSISTTGITPPKLQRIPKSESTEAHIRSAGKMLKSARAPSLAPRVDKPDGSWLQSGNEFLHSHDGTIPKPAQNIALMAGKRYIVVPKNNAMAVQPAITVKPDKIGDKPPKLPEAAYADSTAKHSSSRMSLKPQSVKMKSVDRNEAKNLPLQKDITSIETVPESNESSNTRMIVDPPESDKTNAIISTDVLERTKPNISTAEEAPSKIVENEVIDLSEIPDDIPTPAFTEQVSIKQQQQVVAKNSDASRPEVATTNSISTQPDIIATNSGNLESEIVATNSGSVESDNKKKPVPLETDQRHFMVSVCAGYHALSRIFQYLKVQELLRAARVCKMWRDLAAHPNLWKTVRMKNSQVTDWDGLADSLKRHGTQHLDLRKMLVAGESDGIWKKFVTVIPRVTSLVKLELCRCPVMVVEEVIKSCPQLEVLSAMSIKCDSLNLESVGNLKSCQELRLKAISGMSLQGDLSPLQELTQLTHLSLTSVKELGKKKIDILASLINLETLELGECSDFPDKFGTSVLLKLEKLERLRLEKGQGSCCTFDILEGVSKLETLNQLELVNFDVKNGFDKCLANCKNIKRLLIIPTYISQSATSNNMVLGGVTELSNNLTHFVWGVTLELLRVTELFVDQCNQMNKQVTGDSIPVLKPVPCLKLIEDVEDESDQLKLEDKPQPNLTNPQVDILPLPQLQKLLLTALPKTRVKILKIPFHATWRQSISDTTTQ